MRRAFAPKLILLVTIADSNEVVPARCRIIDCHVHRPAAMFTEQASSYRKPTRFTRVVGYWGTSVVVQRTTAVGGLASEAKLYVLKLFVTRTATYFDARSFRGWCIRTASLHT